MKKILAVALVCAVSSFAAWDYFPVIEHGKSEAKVGFAESRQSYDGDAYLTTFKIRHSPMANLELLSKFMGDAYGNHVFGARYQIMPIFSLGLDVGVPIPSTAWSFTPNAQFSMPLTGALAFGSNVQVSIFTEETTGAKKKRGMDLSAGGELDLTLGKRTIWVGVDINNGLAVSEYNGKKDNDAKVSDEDRGLEIAPTFGYIATVGNLSVGTSIGMQFGEDAGHDNFNTIVGVDFAIKF